MSGDMGGDGRFLIVEARFYDDLADELVRGATAELERLGLSHERLTVPGALEIPPAIAIMSEGGYAGYVALGCVIRGETSHYDYVCAESARGLMELGIRNRLAIGNGILTVENRGQAWARASVEGKNKGRDAAAAAVSLAELRGRFQVKR